MFRPSGPHLWRSITNAGVSALVLRSGAVVVERAAPNPKGWRLYQGENHRDITPTFTRHLRVLAETPEGQIVCASSSTIVWLSSPANGAFKIVREIPVTLAGEIISYAGETATKVFLTLSDIDELMFLAVIDKPGA